MVTTNETTNLSTGPSVPGGQNKKNNLAFKARYNPFLQFNCKVPVGRSESEVFYNMYDYCRESGFFKKKFLGRYFTEYCVFVNVNSTLVTIRNTNESLQDRFLTYITGGKFLVSPDELFDLISIHQRYFKDKMRFVKKNKSRFWKTSSELFSICFDVLNFKRPCGSEKFLATSFYNRTNHLDDWLLNCVRYDRYVKTFKDSVESYFIGSLVAGHCNVIMKLPYEFRVHNLIRKLSVLRSVRDKMIEEILSTDNDDYTANWSVSILLSCEEMVVDMLQLVANESKNRPCIQSGTCGKSGFAYIEPVVMQGLFDMNIKQNHSMDEQTSTIIKNLIDISKEAKDSIGQFTSARLSSIFNTLINTITGGITVRFEGLDEVMNRFDSFVDGLKKAVVILILLVVFKLLKLSGVFSDFVLSIIGSIFMMYGCSKYLGEDLWKKLVWNIKYVLGIEDIVMIQAGYSDIDQPVDVFLSLMQMATLGKAWWYEKDMISAFKHSVTGWSKFKVDFSDSIDTWFSIFQRFVNWISEKFYWKPWKLWEGKYPKLYKYISDIDSFFEDCTLDPTLTYAKGVRLENILREGRIALGDLPASAIHERNLHRSVTENLSSWKTKLAKANFLGSGPRVKPVGILFTGPSQIGKSEWNNVFCRLIAARCLPIDKVESFVKNPSSEVYNRIIEQEYWDGWQDQSIVQIDELGARRDSVGQNNEGFESLRLINGNNFGLHAAGIDEKGMLNARPILVSATSNMNTFEWESLRFQEAFENRYEAYACIPKREFLEDPDIDIFDFKNVKMKRMTDWKYKFEHLECYKYDLTKCRHNGGSIRKALITGKPISPFELLNEVIEKIKKNQEFGETVLKVHDAMIRDELRKRSDAKKIDLLLEDVDASVSKYEKEYIKDESHYLKLLNDEINKTVAQRGKSNKSTANVINYALLPIFFTTMVACFINFAFPRDEYTGEREFIGKYVQRDLMALDKFSTKAMKEMRNKAKGYKDYYDHVLSKRVKDNSLVFMQAAKDLTRRSFGCGDCIVCRSHNLTIEELYSAATKDELWPEGSEKIRKEWTRIKDLSDLEVEMILHEKVIPWCLKLKKDIWYKSDAVIEFDNAEIYSHVIYCYATSILSEMAKSSQRKLWEKVYLSMNLGKKTIYKVVENWKIVAPTILTLSTVCYGVYKFVSKIYPQSVGPKTGRGIIRRRNTRTRTKVRMQSATDGIIDNVMNKVLTRCQYRIGTTKGLKSMGVITMVQDNIGVMPMHFAEYMTYVNETEGADFWIVPAMCNDLNARTIIPFNMIKFYGENDYDYSYDYVFFTIDRKFIPPSPFITKYFVPKDKCPNTHKFHGALYINRIVGDSIMIHKENGNVLPNASIEYSDENDDGEVSSFKLLNAYHYYFGTVIGDCGSLLVKYSNDGSAQRILGIHVSGTKYGVGYGQPITLEIVKENIKNIQKIEGSVKVKDVEDIPLDCTDIPTVQGFTGLGTIEKSPKSKGESKIIKSVLNDKAFPCETDRAILSSYVDEKGEMCDPMESARSEYSSVSYPVDDELLDVVVNDCIMTIENNSLVKDYLVGPRDLTYEEAVYGIDGHEFVSGVKRNTSPGIPWCMEKGNEPGTKHKWLGPKDLRDRLDDTDIDFARVKTRVELILSKAHEGIRLTHLVNDFPKDERRSLEKIKRKKTRFISGTPMDYCIACIVKYGALIEWLMTNRIVNGFCVGVNAFGSEWNAMARFLKMRGDEKNWLDGDYSHFDASHTRQLLYSFKRLADHYYGNEDLARDILLEDLMNSIHVYRGTVYMWSKSLPSGHSLTSMINCWVNLLLNKIAFIKSYCRVENTICCKINYSKALELYRKHVRTLVYGDDNIHSIDKECQKYLNVKEHASSLLQYGYIYTDANKSTENIEFHNWRDVSFLKRKFRYHEVLKTIVAPLSQKTCKDMIQWTKKKDVNNEDLRNNIAKSLEEMSFWPRNEFNEFKDILLKATVKYLDYVPEETDYDVLCMKNYSRCEYL